MSVLRVAPKQGDATEAETTASERRASTAMARREVDLAVMRMVRATDFNLEAGEVVEKIRVAVDARHGRAQSASCR
jgi:hypothetical protein